MSEEQKEPETIEEHMAAHPPDFPTPEMLEVIATEEARWLESSLESTLSDLDHNVLARGRIARDQIEGKTLSFWPVPPSIPGQLRTATGDLRIHHQEDLSEGFRVFVAELRDEPPRHPEIVLHRR